MASAVSLSAGGGDEHFASPPWNRETTGWQEIEHRLSPEHLARSIAQGVARLDLSGLFQSYTGRGSLAHRPDLMLRVVLYELHLGYHSPAAWERHARENEPVRWLALGITPARARWYAFRDRVAPFVDDWNRQVLQLAQQEDLTPATRGALDGTTVAANASRHRLLNEARLQERCEQLQQALAQDAALTQAALPATTDAQPAGPAPKWLAPTPAGRQRQFARYQQAQQRMQDLQRRNQQRPSKERQPRPKVKISVGDPEAALGLDKFKVFRPLYNAQWIVDLDSPLVLSYDVFAQATDAGTLPILLQRTVDLVGHQVEVMLADGGYATGLPAAQAEAAGVTLYAPAGKQTERPGGREAKKPAQLPKSEFRWRPEVQQYECPQGHPLELVGQKKEKQFGGESMVVSQYRCSPTHCCSCPLQQACTSKPEKGRTVQRGQYEESVERLKARMQTPEAKALYRRRSQTVELGFADVKEHRKLRRFSGLGNNRARTTIGLEVLVHNMLTVVEQLRRRQPVNLVHDSS